MAEQPDHKRRRKERLRRIVASRPVTWAASKLLRTYLTAVRAGCRVHLEGPGLPFVYERTFHATGAARFQPIVFACWHQHILGAAMLTWPLVRRGMPLTGVASRSDDAELIVQVLEDVHHRVIFVRGSSRSPNFNEDPRRKDRGGAGALDGMLRALDRGSSVAITVDGPQGPRFESKLGAFALAQRAGVPIVPVAAGFGHALVLNMTWDRTRLPLPLDSLIGGTTRVFVGEPCWVRRDLPPHALPFVAAAFDRNLLTLRDLAERGQREYGIPRQPKRP